MDKILICKKKNNPERVIEKDCVHYFYWPKELGIGKANLLGLKIPISPIKSHDYEPIKINQINGKIVAITRFHYTVFIYFNNLKIQNGKPVADFSYGSHSPLIHVHKDSDIKTEIINSEEMNVISRNMYKTLVAIYTFIVQNKLKSFNCKVKEYELSNDEIPHDTILDTSKMNAYIAIGKHLSDGELRHAGLNIM